MRRFWLQVIVEHNHIAGKRLLVSLGTVKPMVDGLDLISWVMDSAGEVDAEIILHLPANA
ncbi:DUF1205 domain-containing protein, partial [Salmonella enterica subsp. enterica serovar Anatum]|nr:DUF1205 domain-containing protein [Salmonella enterica subsp. enterica serovar Anatum]